MLDKDIKQLLSNSKNVALIGISLDSKKPSNFVMKYLLDNGYNVYPINPIHEGKKVHNQIILENLDQLNSEIDILNILDKFDTEYNEKKSLIEIDFKYIFNDKRFF